MLRRLALSVFLPLGFAVTLASFLYISCPNDREYETWLQQTYQINTDNFSYNGKISEGTETTTDTGLWLYKETSINNGSIEIEAIGLLGIFFTIGTKGI